MEPGQSGVLGGAGVGAGVEEKKKKNRHDCDLPFIIGLRCEMGRSQTFLKRQSVAVEGPMAR